MIDPIEKAAALSQALYLEGKAPEIQYVLDILVDRVEELQATLENLLTVADGITPTEEELLNETAAIDQDCWDDWDEAVREAKEVLTND